MICTIIDSQVPDLKTLIYMLLLIILHYIPSYTHRKKKQCSTNLTLKRKLRIFFRSYIHSRVSHNIDSSTQKTEHPISLIIK